MEHTKSFAVQESSTSNFFGPEILINILPELTMFRFKLGFISLLLIILFACNDETIKEPAQKNEIELAPPPAVKEIVLSDKAEHARKANYYANGLTSSEARIDFNTESYNLIEENGYKLATLDPLSTFSIDVDAASYSNVRRFLNNNTLPPKDAVRIEELINYFDYNYPQPKNSDPFSINTEISESPWNENHYLVHIGLKGKEFHLENLPPSNIVFLLDVSGSMGSPNKLPLLKKAFKLLVKQLRPMDKVSIVVYAGAAGVVLNPTSGEEPQSIMAALENLRAGGSTAGGAGIKLAYKIAEDNFIKNGNNRIVLATDGDFNVGASSDAEMVRLIEKEREKGVFLTVLGFGMGNLKDSKMESLANKGNGNYAYIDNILEAKKVLVNEFGGTMFTIAKDVKIQVEFNPAKVKAYRLIGYENRLLNNEDFNNDKKDAGELGAGHTVTALYEIIPAGSDEKVPGVDDLKYQNNQVNDYANSTNELMTLKLRYKKPESSTSKLIENTLSLDEMTDFNKTSNNFRFSSSVAMYGMLLRESEFAANSSFDKCISIAKASAGNDKNGYRYEFIKLAEIAKMLKQAENM